MCRGFFWYMLVPNGLGQNDSGSLSCDLLSLRLICMLASGLLERAEVYGATWGPVSELTHHNTASKINPDLWGGEGDSSSCKVNCKWCRNEKS